MLDFCLSQAPPRSSISAMASRSEALNLSPVCFIAWLNSDWAFRGTSILSQSVIIILRWEEVVRQRVAEPSELRLSSSISAMASRRQGTFPSFRVMWMTELRACFSVGVNRPK